MALVLVEEHTSIIGTMELHKIANGTGFVVKVIGFDSTMSEQRFDTEQEARDFLKDITNEE
jgi:hypothetical protein